MELKGSEILIELVGIVPAMESGGRRASATTSVKDRSARDGRSG